ncbi:MAG TPA: hypothetical protein VMN39_07945 [Longimicrobiaceae bacterium]|nr:hypothetical protein [Longimicrobiaceae bacterium]
MAMRSIVIAGALAVMTASGCVMPPPEIGPSPWGSRPLEAHLYTEPGSMGGLVFDLNRSAHVAIFEIVPGRGSTLVYPRPGVSSSDGATFAGLRHVRLDGRRGDRYGFLPTPAGYAGPRFFLLVASEEPLRLSRFGPFGSRMSTAMGVHFASMSPYSAMEQLVTLAVPNLESENWTTDFYVDWPDILHNAPAAQLVRIQCGDYVAYVPIDRALEASRLLCPQEDRTGEEQEIRGDTAQTVEPIRRPPAEPVTERIASTQLERPQEYEIRRRAALEGRTIEPEALDANDAPSLRERPRGADGSIRRPGRDDSRPSGTRAADRRSAGDGGGGGSIGNSPRPSPPSGPRAEPRSGGSSEPRVSPAPAPPERPVADPGR